MRRCVDNRRTTPGIGGARGPLTDIMVHGADILDPLGLPPIDHPPSHLVLALDFMMGVDNDLVRRVVFRPQDHAAGLRLVATDIDWARGAGPEVAGTALNLISVLGGRPGPASRLTGDGARLLVERTSPALA